MDHETISGLFNNSALLLAMCLLYYTLAPSRKVGRVLPGEVFSGFVLGAIGVAVMVSPWHWYHGIIFDTRSILLSISGLFFGAVPTAIAMGCTALYRFYLGGSGAVMGIAVIFASGLLGIAWRRWRHDSLADLSLLELYGFGITVHVAMLGLMGLLPGALVVESLLRIGVPVMMIYPVATALLGRLMVSRHRNLRAEEALRNSEERFTNAMEATSDGLWDWDIITNDTYFSPGYYRMLGYQPYELPMNYETWLSLLHPDDRDRALEISRDCIENRCDSFEVEFRMQEKSGGWRWILGRGKAVARDGNGKALRLVGTHVDITERKLAEESLRDTEERYRQVFDNSFDCIFLLEVTDDQRFKAIDINTTVEQLLGITAVEARGNYMEDILAADCRETLTANYRRCVQAGVPISYEETIDFVPGTNDFYTTLIPIADAHGRVYRIVGIAHNITTRKQAEEKVRESEQLYRQLFDLESDAIFLVDAETGSIVEANRMASALYGYEPDALRMMKKVELSAEPENTLKGVRALVPVRMHRKKDGTVFPVEITASDFFWKGRSVHLVAIRDVTERIRAEEERKELMAQLSQSQKMEAVGQLAGGIAHDFNNILTVIFGYAHILLAKMGTDSPLRNPLEQILASATRAAELIKGLLAFSRKQLLSMALIDFRQVVRDMEQMLRRLVSEDIDFRVAVADLELPVLADKGQMGQVLINLVTNAVDALPDGGSLAIGVDEFSMDEQFVKAHGYGKPGAYVVLTVVDTGSGMDEATVKKVFEPFFTTKEVGKGTGLGLAIVYGIVKQHSGFIQVESRLGVGTTFRIFLPREKTGTTPDQGVHQRIPPLVAGNEIILLAEDDENVRRMNAITFAEAGYRVLHACDGQDALVKFREYRDTIDLLVFDVVMPKMDGKTAYEAIKTECPSMKVLFMTGYSKEVLAGKGFLSHDVHFIMKPFTPHDLLTQVRGILEQ